MNNNVFKTESSYSRIKKEQLFDPKGLKRQQFSNSKPRITEKFESLQPDSITF